MIRIAVGILGALSICLLATSPAMAQAGDAWPTTTEPFSRGPGFYLSAVKIGFVWLLFLAWVRTTDWVNRDCEFYRLRPETWIPAVFFPFLASLLFFFVLPSFWLGFPLMVLAYAVPLAAYVHERNALASAEKGVQVDVLNDLVVRAASLVGIDLRSHQDADSGAGGVIALATPGRVTPAPVLHSPGFAPAQDLVDDAVDDGAAALLLEHSPEMTTLCYQIDGVWYRADSLDAQQGEAMLATFKLLAGLRPNEHRARQQGELTASENSGEDKVREFKCHFACQGTAAGERAVLRIEPVELPFASLEDLGLRPQIEEQLKEIVTQSSGFVLFSALPDQGLTTTVDVVLNSCDRLTRDFVAIEEKNHREREIENVAVATYNATAAESPASILPDVIENNPHVVIVRELANAATVNALCEQAVKDRLVLGTVVAHDAAESLLRLLAMRVAPATLANALLAVVNQRLVRKLCPSCKVAYTPSPEVLKSLGLPSGARIKELFNPPRELDVANLCPDCHGLGYQGCTALVELLIIDDEVRQTLSRTPKLDALRSAARRAGMRTLQEEGIHLVTRGVTSVTELKRVLHH